MSTSNLTTQLVTLAVLSLQRQLYHNRGLRLNETSLQWWNSTYDYVIVGGGSAGSVLAARLSQNASVSVLLIEAGGPVTITSDIIPTYYYLNSMWDYRTVPQRYAALGLNGRRVSYPRGRLLGGSSTVNYAVYLRGNRHGFDEWASKYGATGWNWQNALPYFLKAENNTDPTMTQTYPEYHSTSGPLQVSTVPNPDPILMRWNEAAQRMGWPIRDLNGPDQFGTAILQTTQSPLNWTRQSAYSAYIEPHITSRPNLHVLVHSFATKILFANNQTPLTANGIEFARANQTYQVYARKEVIISGGTINSPQLLMLSGIGPRAHLSELQIPVLADLPVGEMLYDHFVIPMDFLVSNSSEIGWSGRLSEPNAHNLYQFMALNDGPLTRMPGLEMFVATGITGNREWPDGMVYLLINQKYYDLNQGLINYDQSRQEEWTQYLGPLMANEHHFQIAFSNFRPLSHGTIRLSSTDPYDHPLIDPNYLSNGQDLAVAVRTMSIGLQIAESMNDQISANYSRISYYPVPVPGCELCPSTTPRSKCYQYLACVARTYTETTSHPVASCRMGNVTTVEAVVDERLRVRGVERLRVVDASVMPMVPNANINAAVIMVAERAADLITHDNN